MLSLLPSCGSISYALDRFADKWGYRPTKNAVYGWAWNANVHIGSELCAQRKATRRIQWKHEPELMQWMLEHDKGQPVANVCADFERDNGFPLSSSQVTQFRMAHGRKGRLRRHGNDNRKVPLGTRRKDKNGWIVKVCADPDKPGSKDNWVRLNRIVYAEAYGEPPEGHQVVYIDRNPDNCTPENLMAIPKEIMAIVNNIGWSSREELENTVARALLIRATIDAEESVATCKVCGKSFQPQRRSYKRPPATCPDCLAEGRKYKGVHTVKGAANCIVCGAVFEFTRKNQSRCPACIAARPKWAADKHRTHYELTGER